ncbi:MAG: arginyltransferase [Thalassolituus sp.]
MPTQPHPCPYLSNQNARSEYVDPRENLSQSELTQLSQSGFRRSGKLVYRPACTDCNECQSVRLPTQEFTLSRNMKRLLKKNQHWNLSIELPDEAMQLYPLYKRYIRGRHADGDMYPPNPETYREFLVEGLGNSRYLVARDGGEVIGVLVFDIFDDGLSSVYCFYAPEAEALSVGTTLIIRLSQLAASLGYQYNYLGYLVNDCRKMSYKKRFQPLQVLRNNTWQPLI